jgi:hypothetical protein
MQRDLTNAVAITVVVCLATALALALWAISSFLVSPSIVG